MHQTCNFEENVISIACFYCAVALNLQASVITMIGSQEARLNQCRAHMYVFNPRDTAKNHFESPYPTGNIQVTV